MIVFIIALNEIKNRNCVIPTSNNFAVNTESPCDKRIPTPSPTTNDKIPTIKVSKTNITKLFVKIGGNGE